MMISDKYLPPIKNLGTASIVLLLLALLFNPLSKALLSEDTRDSVLVSSIPFVAVFITIILLFILMIFMVVLRFNRLIPYRTYRPVELLCIFGIGTGVFFLFQPWQLVSFQYGFLCLLVATLTFIVWSHVMPHSARVETDLPESSSRYWIGAAIVIVLVGIILGIEYGAYALLTSILLFIVWSYFNPEANSQYAGLKPFTSRDNLIAAVLGLIVLVAVAGIIISGNTPKEPYGYSQRQWDRGLRDEQKVEIIAEAEDTFNQFTIPFGLFMSLLPASAVFFISREALAAND